MVNVGEAGVIAEEEKEIQSTESLSTSSSSRRRWTAADYAVIIEAHKEGRLAAACTRLGMSSYTARAIINKSNRDPSYAGPRPRGGAHNVIYDKRTMMDILRAYLALPDNADATIKEMIAHLESKIGSSPAKSTLAEWLEGGVVVFTAVNPTAPNPLPAIFTPAAAPTMFIGELDTALWNKRPRGPSNRASGEIIDTHLVATLVAIATNGTTILARTYASQPSAQDFAMFAQEVVSVVAQQTGLDPSAMTVGTSEQYLRAEHAKILPLLKVTPVPNNDVLVIAMEAHKQSIVDMTRDAMSLMPDFLRVAVTTAVTQSLYL